MLTEIPYNELSKEALEQLSKGAFLNVKGEDKENTMTIAWGTTGFIWGKPIFVVAVRYSRYTYDLINKSNEFTVSIPLNGQLKKELGVCGKESGRDKDKFKECNLTPVKGKNVASSMIEECDLHYECKVVYKQAMEPSAVDSAIDEKFYSNNNYHVMFYGEIVGCYTKK
ncbi:flavin reductase (DIM6/NTAB) family NADH-FMN oxidoreductase RutF [Natranaerovirga pectinivora]|uniref:Flavin reductase (DIM6/NTAB) family NADH-FMN oxidoreductase RutF n=1 Tax=Natranaerovirga pectinivora TaxID=682400 RepID=A0A4R3MMM4_9FIRM|nr:flavin reductase family protein [Natranaerovirga pectinivora]TCT15543.1 flavin reductase (DIM6/NTAB) family NADH-FMN oxidoreductase RutF [Natranaerovirga pectinivora]